MTGIATVKLEMLDCGPVIQAQLKGHSRFPPDGLLLASISAELARHDPVLWRDFCTMMQGTMERVCEELCGGPVRLSCDFPEILPPADAVSG